MFLWTQSIAKPSGECSAVSMSVICWEVSLALLMYALRRNKHTVNLHSQHFKQMLCIYLFINIHKVFDASVRFMVNKHTMNIWHSQLLFTYTYCRQQSEATSAGFSKNNCRTKWLTLVIFSCIRKLQ